MLCDVLNGADTRVKEQEEGGSAPSGICAPTAEPGHTMEPNNNARMCLLSLAHPAGLGGTADVLNLRPRAGCVTSPAVPRQHVRILPRFMLETCVASDYRTVYVCYQRCEDCSTYSRQDSREAN